MVHRNKYIGYMQSLGDLNTSGFWYSWGSWNQSPVDTKEQLVITSTEDLRLAPYTMSSHVYT